MKYVREFIHLLRSGLTDEKYELPKGFKLEKALEEFFKHSVVAIAYMGALNCGFKKDEAAMQLMFKQYMKEMFISENQMFEVEKVYKAFEENGIDFMPVKGCNMKSLYPSPEMRAMGDADILIKDEQYSLVSKVMKNIGYSYEREGNHDYSWDSKGLHVELHFKLIRAYTSEYEKYFGNGWNLAKYHEGHKYYMSHEDEFVYIFIHYTKHFRNGGIGCRHIVDLWVYLRSYPNMDFDYIENIMERLEVKEFYLNTMDLLEYWFNDGKSNEKIEYMTSYIMESGNWGSDKNIALSRGVQAMQEENINAENKLSLIKRLAFPVNDEMTTRYSILNKAPFLLPFMWVRRWYDVVKLNRNKVKECVKLVSNKSNNELNEFEENFRKVGLTFDFKEK